MGWICAGSLEEIRAEGRRVVADDDGAVGVFALGNEVIAWADECPHQGGPVCRGKIMARVVERLDAERRSLGRDFHPTDRHIVCPWHGLEFDIRSGRHPGAPALALRAAEVAIRDDKVFVHAG